MTTGEKIAELRKKQGWSQEELAEKLDISRQAVSKWESGQSVPDTSKIILISELFNVSTDYILKSDKETESSQETKPQIKRVELPEAESFMDTVKAVSNILSSGVMLCVLSPVLLIFLIAFSADGGMSEAAAIAVGVSVLLVFVASAVAMFLFVNSKAAPYEYLEKEIFELAPGVQDEVKKRRDEYKSRHTLFVTLGIVLCILSSIPLIVFSLSENPGSVIYGVCILLILVSIGVYFIVSASAVEGSFMKLLQEGDYSKEQKSRQPLISAVSGIYWLIVTAGFLIYGFSTANWNKSGYIWCIAGIVFVIIMTILKLYKKK